MINAYVLITSEVGRSAGIIKELKKLRGVKIISVTAGEFDIIVRVEVNSLEELYNLVESIQEIPGILRTVTHVVMKEETKE